jgi:hypothetical protein
VDNKWQDEVRELLKPLMMCSVEQRYQFFLTTNFGRSNISSLDLQGSILNVGNSVIDILRRTEKVVDFLNEFRKIPVPEWYKVQRKTD